MWTLLIVAATIWTLYWCYKLIVDWGRSTTVADSRALCSRCADALKVNPVVAGSPSVDSIRADKDMSNTAQNRVASVPKTDENAQANVIPLFKPTGEKDDLKKIKGIGVVMEKTLNDLGITTFKQLADFQQAEVKMVSDALSEFNAGFGDRISRDEWVDQAKGFARKAG